MCKRGEDIHAILIDLRSIFTSSGVRWQRIITKFNNKTSNTVTRSTSGILSGLAAFLLWGSLPIFWKQLQEVPASSITAYRIIFAAIVLIPILFFRKRLSSTLKTFHQPKLLIKNGAAGALLAVNWLIYVWATNNGRVIEISLGYYLLPLIYIVIGYFFLKEEISPLQWLAIFFAAIGVVVQAQGLGSIPWCALGVASTFAIYGVVKKRTKSDGMSALFLETIIIAPFAFAYLLWFAPTLEATSDAPVSSATLLLIGLTGVATVTPLLFFSAAAKRIPLSTIGMLQYIAPTGQFLIGWLYFGESLNSTQVIAFCFIWIAVTLYSLSSLFLKQSKTTVKVE
jgi:chloramphenicol-sensitive protein RarD